MREDLCVERRDVLADELMEERRLGPVARRYDERRGEIPLCQHRMRQLSLETYVPMWSVARGAAAGRQGRARQRRVSVKVTVPAGAFVT